MSATILARAFAAAAIPATIALLVAPEGLAMIVPAVAAVLAALLCRPRAPGRTAPWLFAMLLAAIAAPAAGHARGLVDATMRGWPTIDLAHEAMPTSPPRWLAVTGVLRDGFVLAEYGVEAGGIPDQSRPADAVLVPMTGSTDASIRLQGAVVVARVPAGDRPTGTVTLRGRTEALPPELMQTLVDLGGTDARDVPGVLLDTLAIPTRREAWIAIAVLVLLVIGAAVVYGLGQRTSA